MDTVPLKLVTIIAEAVLEDRLLRELRELGARGYSVGAVEGQGSRGVRAVDFEGKNSRIEVIASEEVTDRILEHVAQTYFQHYAVIAYVSDVAVVRGDKYV
jgi:nitrogen regulatory protein P-II 2